MAWRSRESLFQLTEQGDRDAGVFMVTSPEERRAKVHAIDDIHTESMARLASIPTLAAFLQERGVTASEYLQLLEEKERTGAPLLVIADQDGA